VCGWVAGGWGGRGVIHLSGSLGVIEATVLTLLEQNRNETHTHAHKHTHTHTHTHARAHTYIHVYIHMCVCARERVVDVCGFVCVRERARARARMRARARECVVCMWCDICVRVCIRNIYRHTCMYVCTSQTPLNSKDKQIWEMHMWVTMGKNNTNAIQFNNT